MRTLAALLLIAAGLPATVPSQTARGHVFEDLDGDGQRDSGEPGVPGVAVSNQREVVLTGEDGRYELPVADEAVIFVSKPSGYAVPLSEDNLPRFFYVHRPGGSPQSHYRGVDPTGPLPEAIDFPLTRREEPGRFRIVVLADTQPETGNELNHLRDDVFSDFAGVDCDFGLVLGDIIFDHLNLFPRYIDLIGATGIPFYHVVGNHDMNFDAPDDRHANETFIRHFGPDLCSWNHGQVHFVAIDNIIKAEGDSYSTGFDERALTWLRNDLAHVPEEHLVVICTHAPIRYQEASEGRDGHLSTGSAGLMEVLQSRGRILALSGHTHRTFHHTFGPDDGWTGPGEFRQINCTTACGAWWSGPTDWRGIPVADQTDGTPNGYTFIEFDGVEYRSEFRAAGFGPSHQMRIYTPGEHRAEGENVFLVNVFDGHPGSVVTLTLDEGAPVAMERRPQQDPLAQALYGGPTDSGKPWVNPALSDHIWQVSLPEIPQPRRPHRLRIDVTQPDGRSFSQSRIFDLR